MILHVNGEPLGSERVISYFTTTRVKNIRMSSDWLRIASLLSEISRSMACSAFIHYGHVLKRKRSVLSIKDKNEVANDILYSK